MIEEGKLKEIREEMCKGLPESGEVSIKLNNPKRTKGLVIRSYKGRPFYTEDGEERKYVLDRNIKLNMGDIEDRLLYGQLVNHPQFNRLFTIEDKETESLNFLEHKELEREASDIIMKLSEKDTLDLCRLLLIPIGNNSAKVMKRELFFKFEENPSKFMETWKDSDKSFKILLRNLMDANLCVKKNGRFVLNDEGIGTTFDQGVEFLKANDDMLPALRKQLQEVQKV